MLLLTHHLDSPSQRTPRGLQPEVRQRALDGGDPHCSIRLVAPEECGPIAHPRVITDPQRPTVGHRGALDPKGFELLVLRLLNAMGYGRNGGLVEHSGRSGDGGIDGIISQDPLGLDRIYLQAKRYAPDQTVSRPTIQGFVGALIGAQGDRGVFLTTGSFTEGARVEADRVNVRIELIDGKRLADLMLRHGVGVQVQTEVTLYDLDEDFFDEL